MASEFEKSNIPQKLTDEESAVADKDSVIVILDRGTDNKGRYYWMYLAVKSSKYEAFARAASERNFIRFADYGKILKYGYGRDVPASVKTEMKVKYGYDEDYIKNLARKIQEKKNFIKEQEDKRINEIVAMLKKEM